MIAPAYLKAAAPARAPSLNPSRNSELAAPPPKSPRSRRRRTRSAASVRPEVSIPRAPPSRDERARALGGPFPPLCRAYGLTGVSRRRRIAPPRGPHTPATPSRRRRAHRPRCPARSSPAVSACLPAPQIGVPSSSRPRQWRTAAAGRPPSPAARLPPRAVHGGPRHCTPCGRSTWTRSTQPAPPRAPVPVHGGPVDRHTPPGPQRRHGPGQPRAATWPGRPRSRAPPGLFAKRPSRFFKFNPRSNSVIVSFKICPCFYSLAPAPVGIYVFNPK